MWLFGWYPRKRPASIPIEDREAFERAGEIPIQLTLTSGLTPISDTLRTIYQNSVVRGRAEEWIAEQVAEHHRHESRLERVEWAVLIFVFTEVLFDFLRAFHVLSRYP